MSIFRTIARSAVGGAARRGARRGIGGGIAGLALGAVAARVATRSVPGAILVGGGLLAKYLWDKNREQDSEAGTAGETAAAEAPNPDSPAE